MSKVEFGHQAPEGTYQKFAHIENGKLGTPESKRYLEVLGTINNPSLAVRLNIQEPGEIKERYYQFLITKEDRVLGLVKHRSFRDQEGTLEISIDTPVA